MNTPSKDAEEKQHEIIMGNLLRYGVLLSAFVTLAGAVVYLLRHGSENPDYSTFAGEAKRLTRIGNIWHTAFQGNGRSIIQLGLLLLIATPIARILFSIIGFIVEKDILYTLLTIIVLAIVIAGFF